MLQEKLFELITRFIDDHGKSDVGKENANFIRSLPVLERLLQDQISKEYLFKVLFKDIPIIEQLHDQGFIYAHQSGKLGPYCVGLSSYDIASKGLCSNASNERASSPPKRIDTLLAQAANLICLLAQEVSGATSLNDLSTVLAGYLYHMEVNLNEKVTDSFIQNAWQSFLYNVNLPFRSGNSPFSNITMDFSQATPTLRDKIVAYNGQYLDYTYGEIPADYFDRVNMGFIRAMTKGDHLGNPFTFPLVTVNITDEFDYDNPCWLYFLEKADNFGGFYLQNYCTKPFDEKARELNPLHTPYDLGMLYSNCCRMVFDINDLIGVTGSNPFASGSGVGGINVMAINLNRLMWLSQGREELLYPMIDLLIEACSDALEIKRRWLRENWTELFPYLSYYVKDDKTLFSIISVLGMHEGLKSIGFMEGIYNEEGRALAHRVAIHTHDKVHEMSKKYGNAFTLEFAPSESAACKLAEKDLKFAEKFIEDYKVELSDKNYAHNLKMMIRECYRQNINLLYKEIEEQPSENTQGAGVL